MSFLLEKYKQSVIPTLIKEFDIKNPHMVPRLTKITLSIGLGGADKKVIAAATKDLAMISGRKPVTTIAKTSISNFKLREGQVVGLYVTLRGKMMYSFLEKLVHIAMPSIKDFTGLKASSIDANNNISYGIKDRLVFSEIAFDPTNPATTGMNISFHISQSSSKEMTKSLLQNLDIPIR